MIIPFAFSLFSICALEPVDLVGHLHFVTDEDGRMYSTLQGTGIGMFTFTKYTAIGTTHVHDFGATFTTYERR